MTIEKNRINGSWMITAIIGGRLVQRSYYGYTRKEAVKLFKSEQGR